MSKFGSVTVLDNSKIEYLLEILCERLAPLKCGRYGELLVTTGNQDTSTIYNYQNSNTTSTGSQLMMNEYPWMTLLAWQSQALGITYA